MQCSTGWLLLLLLLWPAAAALPVADASCPAAASTPPPPRIAPQEVGVLLHPRDAKGAALGAGGDGQLVVLNKEAQAVLCGAKE